MDPSTPPAQDVQTQPAAQPVNRAQPPANLSSSGGSLAPGNDNDQQQPTSTHTLPAPSVLKAPPKTSVSVGNIEAGGASIVQEASDADTDEDDEDEIKVAPQETKVSAVSQGGVANLSEEEVELQPAVPEVPTVSVEVEKFVEKSPDLEKPDIPKALSDVGVTHSGPGVIAVPQNNFGVKKMPAITYQQAATQVKKTRLHDSKHWFMGLMIYIWRKLNPNIDKEEEKKDAQADIDNAVSVQKASSQEGNKEV